MYPFGLPTAHNSTVRRTQQICRSIRGILHPVFLTITCALSAGVARVVRCTRQIIVPISSRRRTVFAALLIVGLTSLIGLNNTHAQFVRAYVVEDSITVGDRFTLVVVAEHSQPDSVGFPSFPLGDEGHAVGDVLLLRKLSSGKRLMGVGKRYPIADTVAYEVTTFAIDSAVVASIPFTFTSTERTTTRQTDPYTFPLVSVLVDDATELRDIEPLASFPRSLVPWFVLFAGLLAGFVIYKYLTRARPVVEAPPPPVRRAPPPPVESPLAEANRRLTTLEQTDLSSPESCKPYFVELSEILRNYIERRLHLTALESTSRELIHAMKVYLPRTPIPNEVVADLSAILETSDLAKFADVQHPEELSRVTLTETRVLILRIEDSFRPARQEELPALVPPARHAAGTDNNSGTDDTDTDDTNSLGEDTTPADGDRDVKNDDSSDERQSSTPTNKSTPSHRDAGELAEAQTHSPARQPILFINDTDPEELMSQVVDKEPERTDEDWLPEGLREQNPPETSPIAEALKQMGADKQESDIENESSDPEPTRKAKDDSELDPDSTVTSGEDTPVPESMPSASADAPKAESSAIQTSTAADADSDLDEWIKNAPGASSSDSPNGSGGTQ